MMRDGAAKPWEPLKATGTPSRLTLGAGESSIQGFDAPSQAEASSSAGPVSDPVQSGYVESQDGHIVPTSESSISASATMVRVPADMASCEASTIVLSNVRSLSTGSHTGADRPPSRSLDGATAESTPSGKTGSKSFPADGAASQDDVKTKFDFQIFSATKRKLEAEERRADAETEFYRQEINRSMALARLHAEEKRKIAAIADFHVEERRQAAAKAEMLLEHKKFYVEQQKTEVLKRRLLQLEIKRIKRNLSKDTDAQ
ncbi:hypothetical protein MTO96_010777 [Rhipicephalus appendiculatus]